MKFIIDTDKIPRTFKLVIGMENPLYRNRLLSDIDTSNGHGICYVLDTDYKDIEDITLERNLLWNYDNSKTSMYKDGKANCRWIDYVEKIGKNISDGEEAEGYSRLAFK